MEKAKKIKLFIGLSYLFIVCLFLYFFFSKFSFQEITSYDFLRDNRSYFIELKNSNLFLVSIIFLALSILWVFPFLGFGSPVALMGGFIFGKWIGTLIVSISLTIGATCLYLFANFFLKELIEEKFEKKFTNLTQKIKKNEFLYFFIYRFVGGVPPFFVANILPILFNIKISIYFFGSWLGMIPAIFVFTSLGSGLEKIINENIEAPSFFALVTSNEIYIPVIGFLFLIILSFFIKRKLD